MKILRDAFAEIARLADINHATEAVLHQVDARFVGQIVKLFANRGWRYHIST